MADKVIIEATDVWDYFRWHKEELQNAQKVIAERGDFGVEIWLTGEDDLPLLTVMVDDDEVDSEIALNEKDCYETVLRMYDEYLSDDFLNKLIDDAEGYTASEQLDMIDEREMEIDDAIYSMLDVLVQNLDDITSDPDALCEEVKEHICEYLYRELDISIFRPMYLEDEDGTEEFFEFPYDEMEFDD